MRFCFVIILLGVWCSYSAPIAAQISGGKKSPKIKRNSKSTKAREIVTEFDLEYKLDCTLKLERARTLFEKGLLEKIPKLLSDCAENRDLSSNTREDIYKLLAETHLFLNEEEKAADYYEKLLKVDPFFVVQPLIDHPELVHLSNQFKTIAPFSFGFKGGMQFSTINSKKQFVSSPMIADLEDSYVGEWNAFSGAFFSYRPRGGNLEFNLEILYSSYTYDYEGLMSTANDGTIRLVFREDARFWQTPVTAKYLLGSRAFRPYIFLGLSPMWTSRVRLEDLRVSVTENEITTQQQNTGVDVSSGSDSPLRDGLNFNVLAGLGLQYNFRDFYFFADVRYNRMLSNVVDEDNRFSNNELTDQYFHVDNNFGVDGIGVSLGFGYSFYRTVRVK